MVGGAVARSVDISKANTISLRCQTILLNDPLHLFTAKVIYDFTTKMIYNEYDNERVGSHTNLDWGIQAKQLYTITFFLIANATVCAHDVARSFSVAPVR